MRSISDYISEWQKTNASQTYGDIGTSSVDGLNLSSKEASIYEDIKKSDLSRLNKLG